MTKTAELLHFLRSEEVQQYIRDNEQSDIATILLNPPTLINGYEKPIADQITSRKKAKIKLPTRHALRRYIWPPPLSVEQSSSELAAKYKTGLIKGEHLVDLTGGTGVDTIVLSQNFERTTYVEKDHWLCEVFTSNLHHFDKNIEVVNSSCEDFIDRFDKKATFYIDPARRDENQKKVFRFADCSPDLTIILPKLLVSADSILVKASPLIDLSQGISELSDVSEIHVLSIGNECKEVLFLMRPGLKGEPAIHCVNLEGGIKSEFTFLMSEEKALNIEFVDYQEYLLIPNASILKAGAFKMVSKQFGIDKIAPNTHLYTSEKPIDNFPGRQFRILNTGSGKKLVEKQGNKPAHAITRNYPINASQLAKQLGIKEGGDQYIIGFRDRKGKAVLALASSIH